MSQQGGGRGRRTAWGWYRAGVGLAVMAAVSAQAHAEDAREPEPAAASSEIQAPPRLLPAEARPRESEPVRAIIAVEGRPAPGLMVTLRGDQSTGSGLSYRWQQVGGSPVNLDAPSGPVARFIAPSSGGTLAFLLAVASADAVDTAVVTLRVEGPSTGASLHADAGDDQVAVVGRQVTLNGIRSEPRDRIGFRWVQVAGPRVDLKIEQGTVLTFIPAVPGTYRFALVVASESEISQPDEVEVIAGVLGSPPAGAVPVPVPEAPSTPPAAPIPTLGQFTRQALGAIPGGRQAAPALASSFDEIASRVDLYESYDELFSELARRLDEVVPNEPARRQPWLDRLFVPLTAHLVETMRPVGLDLGTPSGRNASMTDAQRDRLAEQFRELAEGFRGQSPGR